MTDSSHPHPSVFADTLCDSTHGSSTLPMSERQGLTSLGLFEHLVHAPNHPHTTPITR